MTHTYIIGSKYPFYLKKIKNRIKNLLSNKYNYTEEVNCIYTDKIIFYFFNENEKQLKSSNSYYIYNLKDFYTISGIIYELIIKSYEIKEYYYIYNENITKYGHNGIVNEYLDMINYELMKSKNNILYISDKKKDCNKYIIDFLEKEIIKTKEKLLFLESLKTKNLNVNN